MHDPHRRGHQRVGPMEERRNERNEGKRWEKVASKRPSLRHVVEEYGLKVRVFREKLLEIEIVQSKCQP